MYIQFYQLSMQGAQMVDFFLLAIWHCIINGYFCVTLGQWTMQEDVTKCLPKI